MAPEDPPGSPDEDGARGADAPADPGGDEELSAEEVALLARAIGRAVRRRRITLVGYFLALVVLLVGQLVALVVYGRAPRGAFVGWVFLVPLGVAGALLWAFGRWARRT